MTTALWRFISAILEEITFFLFNFIDRLVINSSCWATSNSLCLFFNKFWVTLVFTNTTLRIYLFFTFLVSSWILFFSCNPCINSFIIKHLFKFRFLTKFTRIFICTSILFSLIFIVVYTDVSFATIDYIPPASIIFCAASTLKAAILWTFFFIQTLSIYDVNCPFLARYLLLIITLAAKYYVY